MLVVKMSDTRKKPQSFKFGNRRFATLDGPVQAHSRQLRHCPAYTALISAYGAEYRSYWLSKIDKTTTNSLEEIVFAQSDKPARFWICAILIRQTFALSRCNRRGMGYLSVCLAP